jgi:LysM repeat protein
MMQIIKSRYKVKRGESIYDVARKFDLSVFELKRLNRLRKTKVRRGQLIWVFEKKWIDSEELAKKSFANQQSLASNYINKKSVKKKNKYYKVREGDTLSDIVAKYDGLTLSKIKKLNRLKSIVIKPGMKLRIS